MLAQSDNLDPLIQRLLASRPGIRHRNDVFYNLTPVFGFAEIQPLLEVCRLDLLFWAANIIRSAYWLHARQGEQADQVRVPVCLAGAKLGSLFMP